MDIDVFFNDGEDAGEPASPVLQAVRPQLALDDECQSDKGSESDTDSEVDLVRLNFAPYIILPLEVLL